MNPAKHSARLFANVAVLLLAGCASGSDNGNAGVYDAWRAQRSYVEVTATGSVAHVLGERRGPSGLHEGFLLHLIGAEGHGLTVRVEDNVDVTGYIPLRVGDPVEVRGEYIYDPRGGIIHYTHHSSHAQHPSGYVRVNGRAYY